MITKLYKLFCGCLVCCGITATFTSCDDFFNQESDDVLYAEKEHLNNAVDTIYSVTGILTKLQALADRTILLGEVRGDLVDLTTEASNDLREVATFSISDDNMYNKPSDYYAVINNCNYFITHVDTAMKSNRNENIFMKEYAAVKAIRAWTYLQLVLNYGQVPFYTEALLSKEEAEAAETANKADLQAICTYFINDLASIPERYNTETPGYRTIRGVESKVLFFPISVIRGDLYLWRASVTGSKEDYRQAALNYYKYISERNGQNSAYPTGTSYSMWTPGTSNWTSRRFSGGSTFSSETFGENTELITMIAGDSIRAEGNYSELRNLFYSREENNYKVSISPSQRMVDISESQANCVLSYDGNSVTYSPAGLTEHQSGDLRLSDVWTESFQRDRLTGERIETQSIAKYTTRNVHIYRRMMVYLRMAEALNMAGYGLPDPLTGSEQQGHPAGSHTLLRFLHGLRQQRLHLRLALRLPRHPLCSDGCGRYYWCGCCCHSQHGWHPHTRFRMDTDERVLSVPRLHPDQRLRVRTHRHRQTAGLRRQSPAQRGST